MINELYSVCVCVRVNACVCVTTAVQCNSLTN
jgi:hypothetical protein